MLKLILVKYYLCGLCLLPELETGKTGFLEEMSFLYKGRLIKSLKINIRGGENSYIVACVLRLIVPHRCQGDANVQTHPGLLLHCGIITATCKAVSTQMIS